MDKEDVEQIYNEYSSAIRRNGIMPCAATWVDLDIITLSEVNQKEKDRYYIISFTCRS